MYTINAPIKGDNGISDEPLETVLLCRKILILELTIPNLITYQYKKDSIVNMLYRIKTVTNLYHKRKKQQNENTEKKKTSTRN